MTKKVMALGTDTNVLANAPDTNVGKMSIKDLVPPMTAKFPIGYKIVKEEVRDGRLFVTVKMTKWRAFLFAFKVAWDVAINGQAEFAESEGEDE